MSAIIQIERLSKHYSPTVIGVDDITLDVEDGAFLTLLGPSGCGKSTLLRMIGGFETPTAGHIRLAGQDITTLPPYKRAINMVFQDYALFPHMSVEKNIGYGLKVAGCSELEIRTRVYDALKLVGLYDKLRLYPHQLSGGQRQRIALARAIVRRPKVLLLDEPLSALDAKLREQMQTELKSLQEKVGITFIMVTHDQAEALVMSDRIVVMEKGKIAQNGTPQDLYDHPGSPYVANFIGMTSFLPGVVQSLTQGTAQIETANGVIRANVDHPYAVGEAVTVGLRPEKVRILHENETAPDVIQGRVASVSYYGLALRLAIALQDGSLLHVDKVLSDTLARSEVPQIGAQMRLAVMPHNVFVFANPAGAA